VFLKIAYHGPRAMEELAAYDPHVVPGILGGSSGTTHDAFRLLAEAKQYGARAALFGRKINNSEHQLTFVSFLRAIADGQITPEEAVKAYHGELGRLGIKPYRPLKDDMELTTTATSYAGTGGTVAVPAKPGAKPDRPRPKVTFSGAVPAPRRPAAAGPVQAATVIPKPVAAAAPAVGGDGSPFPRTSDGKPDFKSMTPAQKVAYSRQRIQADVARNGDGQGRR
jgi:hypothetical protein